MPMHFAGGNGSLFNEQEMSRFGATEYLHEKKMILDPLSLTHI